MHIFFSGIGGTGIGPLALVAKQAGYEVSGSDKQNSLYIEYLKRHGISDISIGQNYDEIASANSTKPIDWFVYTSALTMENSNPPELKFCQDNHIKISKRDELLNKIIMDKNLNLIAIAGTHGKTTTTAMTIWTMKQLGLPVGYILPAKSSFAKMGGLENNAKYFVYECDEFDRNFLHFKPQLNLISGIDYDHPDTYPTRSDYNQAFRDFISQSSTTILWNEDATRLTLGNDDLLGKTEILNETSKMIDSVTLIGKVNRKDAFLVASGLSKLLNEPIDKLINILNKFPGVSRRFEKIIDNLYSDYAHTPGKIRGALETACEVGGKNVVVIYEGLHNTRQHFIKDELRDIFDGVKKLYIVPSYLAREDKSLRLWSPIDLKNLMTLEIQAKTITSQLDDKLKQDIRGHLKAGDLVLCLTAGGGGSLDEWLRKEF